MEIVLIVDMLYFTVVKWRRHLERLSWKD